MYCVVIFQGIIIAFMALNIADAAKTTDYCSAKLCRGRKHIGCNNDGNYSKDCSKTAKLQRISKYMRKAIVKKHNEFRNEVASGNFSHFLPAGHMCTMKWNEELAKLAELNVKRCKMKNDICRDTADFHYVGQNLATTTFNEKQSVQNIALHQMELWFNESSSTTMSDINDYSKKIQISNFTQLMQDQAADVGCAILRQKINNSNHQYMACNYSFMNIRGRSVYETERKAATQCRKGVNQDFTNLCSLEEECHVNRLQTALKER